jgi:hypothetical protein
MKSVLSDPGIEVQLYPFPHIVVPQCLPMDLFNELAATFPEEQILPEQYDEGVRIDLHSRHALKQLDGTWLEFVKRHTGHEFWLEVYGLFRDALHLVYPMLEMVYGDPREWPCAPRGTAESIMQMECQPGVNTPQTKPGRVRGPHLDNPIELYGGLLYMGEGEGGDLEVQRLIKPPEFHGKLEIQDECVETITVVPYEPNTLVMFINTPTSIHSVTPRPATDKCRRLVSIAGELPRMLFKTGHGRY